MFILPPRLSFILLLFLTVPVVMALPLHAEEIPETDNRALYVESKTAVASAQCAIDGEDEEKDKERTDVGIGKEVELTLTGKRLKDVDLDSLEWTMEPDNLASIEKSDKEKNQAILTINTDITEDTAITIRVKTNLDEELPERKPLILNIFIPSAITAAHTNAQEMEKKTMRGGLHPSGFDPASIKGEFQQYRLH